MPEALLSVQSVSRVVAGRSLLSQLSFDLAAGEVVAVLGPSGSGKTTLLRLIAGFDAPSAGSVYLHGQAASVPGRVLLPPERRGLALASQDATLLAHLDAVGNAALGVRGSNKAQRLAQARAELQAMGLTGMDGRDVATLSGGEAQRVALARALAAESRLLLLDEPFGNVDRLTRQDLLLRLKARLASGLSALVISHDPADALDLGARVLLLRDGRLVADGSLPDLASGRQGDWPQHFLRAGT